MKMKYYCIWMIVLLGCVSCHDFLTEYPNNLVYIESTSDLDELLLGEGYMPTGNGSQNETACPVWIHVMDDDAMLADSYNAPLSGAGAYRWMADIYKEASEVSEDGDILNTDVLDDPMWKKLYRHVSAVNTILDEIERFKIDPDYSRIKGEAYFLRAGYYWLLINLYAKPYDVKNASTDLGVPLKLTNVVQDKYFTRQTVEEVYDVIIQDLKMAIECLQGEQRRSVYRASEAAARLLLSRVYLYMEKYELSLAECNYILENTGYVLRDLNVLDANASILSKASQEVIFSQGEYRLCDGDYSLKNSYWFGTNLAGYATYQISTELNRLFDGGGETVVEEQSKSIDLRWILGVKRVLDFSTFTYREFPAKMKSWQDGGVSDCFVLRLGEVYLNKAEALAMLGREEEANTVISHLREKRIKKADFIYKERAGEELIRFIRLERRLELCFEGHRWFDLRRYAVNSRLPERKSITHYWRASRDEKKGSYTLNPYGEDGGWVCQIPANEIWLSDGVMKPNEDRPARSFVAQ